MNKILFITLVVSLSLPLIVAAKDFFLPDPGTTPDSPFYFLKAWKESIQTFFTFGAENKANQYLHLAGVRLAEYQKMIEKGKTEIAEKTLKKYEAQLNRALDKVKELQDRGKNVSDLSQRVQDAVSKHLKVLQENLQKVPEQAKSEIQNAIENSIKILEGKNETSNWQTYRNEEWSYELKYPSDWKFEGEVGGPPSPAFTYGKLSDDNFDNYCEFVVVSFRGIDSYRDEMANLKRNGYTESFITVGGLPATKLSSSQKQKEEVYFYDDQNSYRLSRYSSKNADREKCKMTFDQILSTFKFIKQ